LLSWLKYVPSSVAREVTPPGSTAAGPPHAHVLLTTRRIDPDGFAGKDRSWTPRPR